MERVTLEARRREGVGKSHARSLRRTGQVPAIVYGRAQQPFPVAVESKALRTVLHTDAGMNVLIELAIADDGGRRTQTVMVKELQRSIFRRDIIHVDFHTISLEERLEARVRLTFVGQAKGIAEGGVLEVHLRELLVECLPTHIPEHIEVNINDLALGHSIHVRDLVVAPEIKVVTPPEEAVVTVVALKVVEEVTPVPAAAEAAVAPEAGTAEAKPGETKPAPEQGKAAGAKPGETKPAPEQGKAAGAKAAETKPPPEKAKPSEARDKKP